MPPLLSALRPRQWSKNLVVLVGAAFSGKALEPDTAQAALATTGLFCLISSAIYLINDLLDRERDRAHPNKRFRAIAAGTVSPTTALATSLLFAGVGLFGANLWVPGALPALVAYLILQVAYSFFLKHVVLVDVFCIAGGFLLRILGGVWAIGVPVSPWLITCSVELALFLAFCKRKAEILALDGATSTRPILGKYKTTALDLMIGMMAAATVISYGLYTLLPGALLQLDVAMDSHAGQPGMIWTLPLVLFVIMRYLHLVYHQRLGENPNRVLLTDAPLLVAAAAYCGIVTWVIYLGT